MENSKQLSSSVLQTAAKIIDAQLTLVGELDKPKTIKIANIVDLMYSLDTLLGTYGMEFLSDGKTTPREALYLNVGDTYMTTLLVDLTEWEVHIISWGEWLEKIEVKEKTIEAETTVPTDYLNDKENQ